MLSVMRSFSPARRLAPHLLVAAGLSFSSACSDDEPGDGAADAGPGVDAAPSADAGSDAGPLPACTPSDEPPLFPCNPVDGTRCELETGTRCVLDPVIDEGACVCLDGRKGFQEPCDTARFECASGFSCFALQGDDGPTCQKICAFETGVGCEEIDQSGVEAFECAGLQAPDGMGAAEFGLCVSVGESCDLVTNDCPDNQTCTITGLQTACADVGNQALGETCSLDARCERGLVCVQGPTDVRPVCNQVCDPEAEEDECPTFQRCNAFRDIEGGICSGS